MAKFAPAIVASVMFTFMSLSIPDRVHCGEDLTQLGFPARFMSQDVSALDPPSCPVAYGFMSPWEHPVHIDARGLALSAGWWSIFWGLVGAFEIGRDKTWAGGGHATTRPAKREG